MRLCADSMLTLGKFRNDYQMVNFAGEGSNRLQKMNILNVSSQFQKLSRNFAAIADILSAGNCGGALKESGPSRR